MCVKGTYGFQWTDRQTNIIRAHNFTDQPYTGDTTYVSLHGIAMKPDQTEIWTVDRGNFVHVTDISDPSNPRDKTRPGGGARVVLPGSHSHWITFSIDGQYAYVGGPKRSSVPARVVNTATYSVVDSIQPTGAMVEVDYGASGTVTRVGSQFGLGRVSVQ
jgi:hypothetical protein